MASTEITNPSLFENEIHSRNKQAKTNEVISRKLNILKKQNRKENKDYKRNYFLEYFQLNEVERAAVLCKTNPVGRHLETILKKRKAPAHQHY